MNKMPGPDPRLTKHRFGPTAQCELTRAKPIDISAQLKVDQAN